MRQGFIMKVRSFTPDRAKKFKLSAVCLVALALALACAVAPTHARADGPLEAIDYLDYVIDSPEYVWADGEAVVVCSGGRLVFFTGGRIYQTDLKCDGEIMRYGSSILYFHDSLLFSTEIGTFEETPVTDADGTQITANSFSACGDRLLVINSSGAVLYEGLVRTEISYSFDSGFDTSLLRAARVLVASKDYYSVGGEIYANGAFLKARQADYMTELNGELYFSNKEGIFKIPADNGAPVLLYDGMDGEREVCGICAYGDSILFIDGASGDLMQMTFDSGVKITKFVFDVEIKTDLSLTYTQTPTTVRVEAGTRMHTGVLEGGCFTFLGTEVLEGGEDLVCLGAVGSYSLVYGHGGYALVGSDKTAVLEQNNAISFEKGVILHDCPVFITCVANGDTRVGELKKGAEVSIGSVIIMNGVRYSRVQFEGGEGFILTGEATVELLPSSNSPTNEKGSVTGKDNTLVAVVIILLSTGIFVITMFVLLVKKEFVKL